MEQNTATLKMLNKLDATMAISGCSSMGVSTSDIHLERMQASPNYQDGRFVNSIPTNLTKNGAIWYTFKTKLFGDHTGFPPSEIPIIPIQPESLKTPPLPGLGAFWLGHASVLIEIEGIRLLIDPVFSRVVSPVSFLGPKRFHPSPIALTDLSRIDAVMISHNHYDRLEKTTIQYLAAKGTSFLVPLGVGAQLKEWEIQEDQIIELDWWESAMVGRVRLDCTPARHFSGRSFFDKNQTLWSSWAIIGAKHSVFYSGDTGYSDHFQEVGHRLGPFDLTLMKVGGYDSYWPEIHLDPEQSIEAHLDVRGQRLLPVHWCSYDLSLHDWDEPIKRIVEAAKQKNIDLVTPHIGEFIEVGQPFSSSSWWEKIR
ncbi:MAG: metal-dependent hydrolase [Candidatus Scalindua rubra]|uniref:Metal-dependent hydrolase n=1 Tax=Candidatus Scalindua rubra TaxID=1872076 RepID=A0A1E3X9N1_9BACT|nr:MAG: metal-dependent hydrolase [Candidatus Scalindua rubra]